MDNQFSFKSFENVRLKATYKMEIGNRTIQPHETIVLFDKIQIAGLTESVSRVAARGGFDNRARVMWETTKEVQLTFAQGVVNKEQFSLLLNSNIATKAVNEAVTITQREILESNDLYQVTLMHEPSGLIFVYTAAGELVPFTRQGKVLDVPEAYQEYTIDYEYNYANGADCYQIGSQYFQGWLELEGLTNIKDDTTGQVTTGVIKIPKLHLSTALSLKLGLQATPMVAAFTATCVPVGTKGNLYVSEIYQLNDNILAGI